MTSPSLIVLDRDGVLNHLVSSVHSRRPPWTMDEVQLADDAAESVRRLSAAGYTLMVATNQPDIARGSVTRPEVDRVNRHIHVCLPMPNVEKPPQATKRPPQSHQWAGSYYLTILASSVLSLPRLTPPRAGAPPGHAHIIYCHSGWKSNAESRQRCRSR